MNFAMRSFFYRKRCFFRLFPAAPAPLAALLMLAVPLAAPPGFLPAAHAQIAVEEPISDAAPLLDPGIRELLRLLENQRLDALRKVDGALDPAWQPLLLRLREDGFPVPWLEDIFSRLGPHSFTPAYMGTKITELYGVGGIGIDRKSVAPPRCPANYNPPVPDATAGSCLAFLHDNKDLFSDILEKHGVDKSTLLAVLLVETAFGLDLGKDRALRVLASMALTGTADMLGSMGNQAQKQRLAGSRLSQTLQARSEWAYNELTALLRHGQERDDREVAYLPSSSMGAIGLCQFMPSNLEPFGVDGDGDGIVDLFSVADALYSAANYLEAHGWRQANSEAAKLRVLMAYNHDSLYAAYVAATARQVDRALKGKVPAGNILMAAGIVPSARLDPSLRRLKPPPPRARVQGLGDYKSLIQ